MPADAPKLTLTTFRSGLRETPGKDPSSGYTGRPGQRQDQRRYLSTADCSVIADDGCCAGGGDVDNVGGLDAQVIEFSFGLIGAICIKTAVLTTLTYKLATVKFEFPTRPFPSHAASGVVQIGNHPEVQIIAHSRSTHLARPAQFGSGAITKSAARSGPRNSC
jgi:hypothetical protein